MSQAPVPSPMRLHLLPEDGAVASAPAAEPADAETKAAVANGRRFIPWVAAGLFSAALCVGALSNPDRIADAPILLLGLVAAVVILDQARLDVFERANISPACAPSIALAYFFGPLGPLTAEACIALARVLRRDPLVKWVYDFGALTLAGHRRRDRLPSDPGRGAAPP